jgi:hypothetical protein
MEREFSFQFDLDSPVTTVQKAHLGVPVRHQKTTRCQWRIWRNSAVFREPDRRLTTSTSLISDGVCDDLMTVL